MMPEEGGRLADNLVHFARALRAAGIPVGPGAVLDALAAVEAAGIGAREDFYWILHAVFVKRHEHSLLFDQAFRIFFRRRGTIDALLAAMLPQAPAPEKDKPPPGAQRVEEALLAARGEPERKPPELETDARLTVSDREVLQKKDFAQMSAAEIAAAKEAIKRLVLSLDEVRTRRLARPPWPPHRHPPHVARKPQGGRRGDRPQISRPPRQGAAGRGAARYFRLHEPVHAAVPAFPPCGDRCAQARAHVPVRHAAHQCHPRAQGQGPRRGLAACAASVADWSGGTRIATSLHAFNKLWARRVLTQGAIVLLITDGLERDPDDRLAFEIDRLHRSCRRLIWLNPLLRFSGFEAKAKGIRAMLPHVDELRPIHNLDSMAELVRALSADGGPSGNPKAWLEQAA